MDDLPRKRLFSSDKADPGQLAGAKLALPDIRRYFQLVHSRGGWGTDVYDEQNTPDFRFDGRSLSVYAEKVLGRGVGRVYMPLAYNGVVAKELSDAGFPLLASDLSEQWVAHLQGIGLRAEVRSFEDMPAERFDTLLCFESYPVSCNLVGYLGLLRALTMPVMYIEIMSHPHLGTPPEGSQPIEKAEPVEARTVRSKRSRKTSRAYPMSYSEMVRQAYDYGAAYSKHCVYHDEKNWFDFESVIPTPASIRRMALDLRLLERQDEWAGETVSIRALSKMFSESSETIAASLSRLLVIASRYHFDSGLLLYAGIRHNALSHEPGLMRTVTLSE